MKRLFSLYIFLFIAWGCLYATNITKPIIGISCSNSKSSSSASKSYCEAISNAGGVAIMIPVSNDSIVLRNTLQILDGIVMTGGGDIHPSYFGESPIEQLGEVDSIRDIYDMLLIKMAKQHNIPMLGICRGEQLINVAFGGTLFQDLPSQYPNERLLKHCDTTHHILLQPSSWIANITNKTSFETNTYHHQAVKDVAKGFKATGHSIDSVIEVIENIDGYPIWGVQFHPERMVAKPNDSVAHSIFDFFIKKASTFKHAKELHKRIISIDTHTDSPLDFVDSYSIGYRGKFQVDIPKMHEGHLDAQYLACWVQQGDLTPSARQKANERINYLIDRIYEQVAINSLFCGVARNANDIITLKSSNKKAFLIGIENGYAIGTDLTQLKKIHDKGVTYITLCHSKNNDICDSSSDKKGAKWNGLSPFGEKVVTEMNRLGILIDLSHASDSTFWDVIKITKTPVFTSHSSSRAMFDCDRNLSDDQIRAIAQNGGVIQVCLVDEFLTNNPESSNIEDFINHLCHIIDIAGIDHVGIGSDFDGGAGVKGCNGDNDLIQITTRLINRGYSDDDIAKIWGKNFLRVLTQVQEYASTSYINVSSIYEPR